LGPKSSGSAGVEFRKSGLLSKAGVFKRKTLIKGLRALRGEKSVFFIICHINNIIANL